MKVKNKMTRHIITVSPEDTLKEALDIMNDQEIRHLPVVNGTELVGILPERDVLAQAKFNDQGTLEVPDTAIGDVMTTSVETCGPDSKIADAATIMVEHKIDCLPVTDSKDNLVGLITSTDLLDILSGWKAPEDEAFLPFKFSVSTYEKDQNRPRPWA